MSYKSYITFVMHLALMMAQNWAEITWEISNYGRFINQFPLNIIRSIRQFEKIKKKYVDKNVYNVQSNMYQWRNAAKIYIYIYIWFFFLFTRFVYTSSFSDHSTMNTKERINLTLFCPVTENSATSTKHAPASVWGGHYVTHVCFWEVQKVQSRSRACERWLQEGGQHRTGKSSGVWWSSVVGLYDDKSTRHEKNSVWRFITEDLGMS